MATETPTSEETTLPPDEAFNVVGDETRIQILQALGEADKPLSYSDLLDRIDYESTNLHYHLKQLSDHFIQKTEDGYALRQAGRKVVVAVLSGAMTGDPVLERTPVEAVCPLCGGNIEMRYHQWNIVLYCTDYGGTRGGSSPIVEAWADPADDVLGHMALPPAGVYDRTPTELLAAAEVWTVTEALSWARGVCPRCSAQIDATVHVCEDHKLTDGRCEACDQRFSVTLHVRCTNCITEGEVAFGTYLLGAPDLMAFMIDHGIDPLRPDGFHVSALDETILSTDPFEGRFTFTADDDTLTLTVDDDLSVVDITRGQATEAE